MNLRPLGYEPNELPDCSTPRRLENMLGRRIPTDNSRCTYDSSCACPAREAIARATGFVDGGWKAIPEFSWRDIDR